ncbi:MAG: MATE family multidrug resistance protein [Saprospiraceae bacterium]|jgi:MATE family multidrug resistance protein
MSYAQHVRALSILGLPLIGGHLAQFAIGLTDTVMLGWYGIDALAAITLASSYFFTLFIMGGGFAFAVMPMVASFNAEGDETSLRRAARMGMWLSIIFAVLVAPLFWWSSSVLQTLGQTEQLADAAQRYLRVAGWAIFPALLAGVIKSYLAALEKTIIVLWISLASAIVNGLANYALIFGHWGAPELGLQGAAIASFATQILTLVAIVVYAMAAFPKHALFLRLWRLDPEMFGKVFRLGWPISLTGLAESGLFIASALMMGWLGTVALAAHGIAMTMVGATFMVHIGLSNAATIRAGNAFGRQDPDHLAKGGKTAIVLSLIMSFITIMVFFVIPEPLIGAFLDSADPAKEQIVSIGSVLLAMAALFQLVDGAQAIALGLLRGVQDTKTPMVIAAISYWVVGIPSSYLLGFVFGYGGVGVWSGLVFGLAFAAVLLLARFWGPIMRDLRGQ